MGPPQARRGLLSPAARQAGARGLAALAALLLGCAHDAAREADRAFTAGLAQVDELSLDVVSLRPPRLRVDVRGTLPDACTEIDPVHTQRLGARIEITLGTRRPFGADCAPEPTPFTRSIPLAVGGTFRLWIVDVNGKRASVALPPEPGSGAPLP